jgi:hypothetical protein
LGSGITSRACYSSCHCSKLALSWTYDGFIIIIITTLHQNLIAGFVYSHLGCLLAGCSCLYWDKCRIGRTSLSTRFCQFIPDRQLLRGIFDPIFFAHGVVEKVGNVPRPASPRFVLNLVHTNIKGGTLGKEARIATRIFFTLHTAGCFLGLLQFSLLFLQQPSSTLSWIQFR